ncbi:phytase [Robiginitalea biformata]|uniref:phytase n=1 Tax=Robiginitalea biformata TaxID=252307 RepID=UPI003B590D13
MKVFTRFAVTAPAVVLFLVISGCGPKSRLPAIKPDIISEYTLHDTDDPAIWVNPDDPAESIVFGTDKESDGAVYAFDLNGKVIEEMTLRQMKRPNNVDVEYGVPLNDSVRTDIIAFTERERQVFRVFSVPDMKPLDGGGFPVFQDATEPDHRLPMGIALYASPKDSSVYVIVGRKSGPLEGYLHQYQLVPRSGELQADFVRAFGSFSGTKEVEAIAVDDELGYVYYSDEGECIRKYHAEPDMGDAELACFGGEYFLEDIEGIAIAAYPGKEGYILVSNQQLGEFNIFKRGDNTFVKAVNLSTRETDGCEVVTKSLGPQFPNGLFVAMNDEKNFYYYDLSRILDVE